MRPLGSQQALERRRVRAMTMIEKGMMPVEVAKRVGVDRRSVRRWKAFYRKMGIEGLKARPILGRPRVQTFRRKRKVSRRSQKSGISF
jgi:transposase